LRGKSPWEKVENPGAQCKKKRQTMDVREEQKNWRKNEEGEDPKGGEAPQIKGSCPRDKRR